MQQALDCVPGCGERDEADIEERIDLDSNDPGYQLLNDEEISQLVTDKRSQKFNSIAHNEAFTMLAQCLPWLEHRMLSKFESYFTHMLQFLNSLR